MYTQEIKDKYGDPITVTGYVHGGSGDRVFVGIQEGDNYSEVALDRSATKQLRKALKRALKERS